MGEIPLSGALRRNETKAVLTLLYSACRFAVSSLGDRLESPEDRLGSVIERPGGEAFVVIRETRLETPRDVERGDGAVLVFELHAVDLLRGTAIRSLLERSIATVATPFFAGLPGFRRKLWLVGEDEPAVLELYEWSSPEDAERYADALRPILGRFLPADAFSFEVVEHGSVEGYVADRSLSWRGDRDATGRRRRSIAIVLVAAIVGVAAGYVAWKRRRSTE